VLTLLNQLHVKMQRTMQGCAALSTKVLF